jgi:hypothetical protein
MTTTRLLIVGEATLCGEAICGETVSMDGVVTESQNVSTALVLCDNQVPTMWWENFGQSLVALARTCPVLFVGLQRPAHLPFKASWFSSPGEAESIFHRTLTGMDHLDFVYWTGGEDGPEFLPSVTGVQAVLFSASSLSPDAPVVRPGVVPFVCGTRLGVEATSTGVPLTLWELGPDGTMKWYRVDFGPRHEGSPGQHEEVGFSMAELPTSAGGGLVREVLAGLARDHGAGAAGVVSSALNSDLPPLKIQVPS